MSSVPVLAASSNRSSRIDITPSRLLTDSLKAPLDFHACLEHYHVNNKTYQIIMGSYPGNDLLSNDSAATGFASAIEIASSLPRPSLGTFISTAMIAFFLARVAVWARHSPPANIPPRIADHYPFIGSLGFWTERWQFWKRERAASATGNFSFYVGSNLVLGLCGESSRKWFFETKGLGMVEGYRMLMGTAPSTTVKNKEGAETWGTMAFSEYFLTRVTRLLRHDHIQERK